MKLDGSDDPPEFIELPDGHYGIQNQRTGKLDTVCWKHLTSRCGDDFERYVRTTCDDCDYDIPYHPTEARELQHRNLWVGRKLRVSFLCSSPVFWTRACVLYLREVSRLARPGDPSSLEKSWIMGLDFGKLSVPGVPVRILGIKPEQFQQYNGKLGLLYEQNEKGQWEVLLLEGTLVEGEMKGKWLLLNPDNLTQIYTHEFVLHRVNVQGGGILVDQSNMNLQLSFEWMERISEEIPWYFVCDPPEATWRRPFTADEKFEDLRTYRAEQLDKCLQQESEGLISENLTEIKDHTIKSLKLLTRHGSKDGMLEARRLLLTHPLAMVVLIMKELNSGGCNKELHLLHAAMVSLFEIWKQTNGFRAVEFGPTERTAFALAEIIDLTHLREWALAWWVGVLEQFRRLKEFRAVIQMFDEFMPVLKSKLLSQSEGDLVNPVNEFFVEACYYLCDFERLVATLGNHSEELERTMNEWTGTSLSPPTVRTSFEEIYSPRRFSNTSENCFTCGYRSDDPYWCKKCGEIPYCSKNCSEKDWFDGGHRRVCRKAADAVRLVKPCVVCGKASIVGCNRCIFTYYCSQECQMKHWYEGGHEKECPRRPLPDPP